MTSLPTISSVYNRSYTFTFSCRGIADKVRSAKPKTILMALFAIWSFTFLAKSHQKLGNIRDLQARLRATYVPTSLVRREHTGNLTHVILITSLLFNFFAFTRLYKENFR
jgi:hypothetical protein